MARNAVYTVALITLISTTYFVQPYVQHWPIFRGGLGWILVIGMLGIATLIFLIFEFCGIYLWGKPQFIRRKRTGNLRRGD